jgi:hypothetical protein
MLAYAGVYYLPFFPFSYGLRGGILTSFGIPSVCVFSITCAGAAVGAVYGWETDQGIGAFVGAFAVALAFLLIASLGLTVMIIPLFYPIM